MSSPRVFGLLSRATALGVGAIVFATSTGCGRAASTASGGPRQATSVAGSVGDLCAGVSPGDRERPFFFRRAGVETIHAVLGDRANAKFAREELRGVEIAVRGGLGVTRHQVMRVLRCHAAWSEALGLETPGFEDPLKVGVPQVSLVDAPDGVTIRIEGHNWAQGEEIMRRASALLESGTVAAAN